MVVWKWQKTDHQPFSGDFVGKRQKFLPFSNNHNQLFENGRKQTINNFVGTLLENGRNFGRFPTTGFRPFSNNPKCFGRFPTKRFRPFSYNFFRPFSTSPSRLSSISYGTNLKSLFTKILQGSVDSKATSLMDEERFLNCFGNGIGSGGSMDFFCLWREWMQVGFLTVKIL